MADDKDAPVSDGKQPAAKAAAEQQPGYQPPVAALPVRPVASEPTPEPQDDSVGARVERAIAAWMEQHIHNSPVSRDTAVVNHLTGKLADLRRMICEGIG